MKVKISLLVFLLLFSLNAYSQKSGKWSGTIRLGGGNYGTLYSYITPVTVALLRTFNIWADKDFQNWSTEQHGVLKYLNIGGDILVPNWKMTATNSAIELLRWEDDNFLNDPVNQYSYYIGYYFNWKNLHKQYGFFFGADYEWKNFMIHYPYPNNSYNKISSLVPTIGLRYRLISPEKEFEGFPFNIELEGGFSYVLSVKYDNYDDYGADALNNGFRSILGIAITTNRFGSIHVRWTKDLYNLFNNNYSASKGPLFNNELYTNFSCFAIGWAIFI